MPIVLRSSKTEELMRKHISRKGRVFDAAVLDYVFRKIMDSDISEQDKRFICDAMRDNKFEFLIDVVDDKLVCLII